MKEIGEVYVYGRDRISNIGGSSGNRFRKGGRLVLVPYRTLSVRTFDFPFGSVSAIREALKIQYSSISGNREVEIFPVVHRREDRRFSGSALILPSEERAAVEDGISGLGRSTIWPLPFAMAAELGGNGAVLCLDEEGISSALFVDGVPVLYRWQSRSRRSVDQELRWLLDYGGKFDFDPSDSVVVDVSEDGERLAVKARETLTAFPSLGSYSLSRKVLDSAIVLETLAKAVGGFSCWFLLAGCVFLGAGFLGGLVERKKVDTIRARAEAVYTDAFGPGKVRDPLSQARGKLAELTDSPDTRSLEDGLRLIVRSWTDPEMGGGRISVDTLRYTSDGMELIGTAEEVSSVQAFQKNLKINNDGTVKLGDIQQVPGGGLRYSLEVRWSSL
ncbi:hypothetical protein Dpep_0155 [Dethiosulfovibrio peptidovorans DSM 11002]|uniref:Uncharacterized protein n=1 Tax=Dethiosulfovibrio peptidovorans DSM 11002 TaxID=469381 RepID=D2Z2W9_9BACT|nr:type II secretion system protein GspL [Dethiosulfovibrio peptidovorans]EFC90187.1 hypothetical protein Dpep_0155 [Dethiosulfovibrio peptidovorans DSM 11002]